ncbi:MAG: hypothetical protein HKN31_04405 [Pricia sp.]|nr:hypothetical protein [Pricia sp.]
MNAKSSKYSYKEWFDSEEMHQHSKNWFSELSFIRDEQQFLDILIQSFAIKPIDKKEFAQINDFKMAISENRRRLNPLLKQVQKHMNQLEIMMDDVNQLEMEKAYQKTHKKLIQKMNDYVLDYRTIKERGFSKLSSILKTAKQKIALGNPDYVIKPTNQEK